MNPELTIPRKLQPFVDKKKRFKIALGGRGAGKSQSFADIFLMKAHTEGAKVGCFREYQTSIDDSVFSLLVSEIDRIKAPGYTYNKTQIETNTGGSFRFSGLARMGGSVKSKHGFKYFWVEEGQFLSKESLQLLTPTLRTDDAECWISMNPMSSADPVSQRFIEPYKAIIERDGFYEDDLHLIIKINFDDNPWFPEGLNQERLFDLNNLPRNEYDHIWLGAYNDQIEGSIILPEWFDACIDAHLALGFKPRGKKIVAFDPSDEGKDDKGICIRHGSVIVDVDFLSTGDAADGMDWALEQVADADLFAWDCDGLGISLKRQVSSTLNGKHCKWSMFKGSEGVDRQNEDYEADNSHTEAKTNHETFRNKRAQYYWELRDRIFHTFEAVTKKKYTDPEKMISFSSGIKAMVALKSEICRIPKKHNANGMIQIMSKIDMKRLKIKSPNMADAVMMSMRMEDVQDNSWMTAPMETETGWIV
jgi:phage terminase large subunit